LLSFVCQAGGRKGDSLLSKVERPPQREFLEGTKENGVPLAEAMPRIAPLFPPVKSREESQGSKYPPHLQLRRTVTQVQ